MARRQADQPITFSFAKGLDESQEVTTLPAGFLASGTNWVPEPTGGLRTRVGWLAASNAKNGGEAQTYPSTDRQIRGMFLCSDYVAAKSAGRRWWVVALINPNAASARQVWVLKADALSDGWYRIMSTASAWDLDSIPIAFCKSATRLIISHPEHSELLTWDLNEDNDNGGIAAMSRPGRALAFHKDRVFVGGSGGQYRYRLHYSAAGNDASWTLGSDFIDVGADDGEYIEDLLSFSGQLIIAKRSSLWIMSGGSPATFSLTRLEGARGSPGRCLISTPNGLVILGETQAWLWQGGDPLPISEPVRSTYATYGGGAPNWRTGAYAGGKVYIAGIAAGHPLMVFDPFTFAWHIEDQPSNAERWTSVFADGGRLGAGPKQGTISSPLNYRDLPSGARSQDFSTLTEAFTARTPDFPLTQSREPMFVSALFVQVRQRAGSSASTNSLTIKPYVDGAAIGSGQDIAPKDSPPKVWSRRIPVNKSCTTIGLEASTTVPAGGGALYDIERVTAELQIEPSR